MFYILLLFIIIIYIMKKFKFNYTLTFLCSFLIIFIVLFPEKCIAAALKGAKLFVNSVFPSLFPFVVIINIIMLCGGIGIYSRVFGKILCKPLRLPSNCSLVLISSLLCGYPIGAKYTCELLSNKEIDTSTARKLLNVASNPSPLFVIGAVGASMFGNKTFGYLLLISNIISCVFIAYLYPTTTKYKVLSSPKEETETLNLGLILKKSVEDAIATSLNVFGFLVIFSVITSILNSIFFAPISSLFSEGNPIVTYLNPLLMGAVEMTNGIHICSLTNSQILIKLLITSFLLSFSGISIITQVYSFTYKHDELSIKAYVFFKFLQGIISSCVTLILYFFAFTKNILPTMSNHNSVALSSNILIVCLTLLITPFIFNVLNKKNM